LSAKIVPTFSDRGSLVVSVTDPYERIEAEWIPFQTHYFSKNLVAPGIEPGPLDL
jgi:hypothetical protein